MRDHLQNPQYEPNCSDDVEMDSSIVEAATPVSGSASEHGNSDFLANFDLAKNKRDSLNLAGHADSLDDDCDFSGLEASSDSESHVQRDSSGSDDTAAPSVEEKYSGSSDASEQAKSLAYTSQTKKADKKKKKKKNVHSSKRKKKQNRIVKSLKGFFPARTDRPAEVARKTMFLVCIIVISGCIYAIMQWVIETSVARSKYKEISEEISPFINSILEDDEPPKVGVVEEYLDYNEIGNTLLRANSDTVGFIVIEGTPISYPVVQRKSADVNVNTNDYYLYRGFDMSESKPGCIFMDYRCHFDEVVNHRRTIENSANLLIYGHNMKDESMFGCLRNYQRNIFSDPSKPSFYSKHPIILLSSLYETYRYKIFAVFLVDGGDTTSDLAFDCWNTFDFGSEDAFYQFVNAAKRRTIVSNNVDVTYGDQLLTLYTCSGTISNGKLIVMARRLRPNEDPLEGTQNAYLNDNILWPTAYYNYHKKTYDESKFVPFH